jgi:PPOX class probable FMN-dependent enzyme
MTSVEPTQQITDLAQLLSAYREPGQAVIDKVIDHVDEGATSFIVNSPLFVLATASAERVDSSPRGGPPGFVRVLDEHHLAWGDLTGNNRLDSFRNLVTQPRVGLVFLVPGVLETLRVHGTAALVQDADTLRACAIDGRVPKAAVVVTVEECYIQCGAALRRSDVWDPGTWPTGDDKPSAAAILKEHMSSPASADDIASGLHDYYENHRWIPGGRAE